MPRVLTHTQDLDDIFHNETNHLSKLIKYVLSGRNFVNRGRVFDGMACAVFWPHMADAGYLERISHAVYRTQGRREQDRAQLKQDFSHADQIEDRWRMQLKFVQLEAEHLLGPLLLPPDSAHSAKLASDWAAAHGITSFEDPQGELYLNPKNYTCFRRIQRDRVVLLRPQVVPPELPVGDTILQDVPEPLVLIYAAWRALTNIQKEPFDPMEVGLDWTRTGHIFVNWSRFYASRFMPKHVRLAAAGVNDALAKLPRYCSINPALIPPDFDSVRTPPPKTPRLDLEVRSLSLYLEMCIRTDAFDYTPGAPDPATLFDPLVLLRKESLFDGRWHWRRTETARVKQAAYRQAKKDGVLPAGALGTKVYTLTFRPEDYLKDIPESTPRWFPSNLEETVYAIRRQKKFCFVNPPSLGQATEAEHEVWKRVMDSVKLLETVYETKKGTVVDIRRQCRSKFFSEAKEEHLQRFLQAAAEEGLAYNITAKRTLAAARTRAAREFQDRTGLPADGWYHYGVLPDAIAKLVDEDTYRRVAEVIIPDQEHRGLQARHFFTEELVTLMGKFALAATTRAVTEYNPDLEVVMTNAVGFTPYILAWTRFCAQIQRTPVKALKEGRQASLERSRRWSPAEDDTLLFHYRRYPKMSTQERKAMLAKLPERDYTACRNRVTTIRKLIEKGVSKPTAERLRIGFAGCDAKTARRLVFLYGVIRMLLLAEGFRKSLPVVNTIVSAETGDVRAWVLPSAYNGMFLSSIPQ